MLSGEEPETRPPPVPAVVMPEPEALVGSPHVRRRYILKQDVARYGRRQDVRIAQLWPEEHRE